MAETVKNYLDLHGLTIYDGGINKKISEGDAATLAAAKTYADSLSVNYDPAGKAKTLVDELASGDVAKLKTDVGDVDSLTTTAKNLVGAVEEIKVAIGTGGTAAVVTITSDVTTDGMLKSYTIKQGDATIGVIDIPKDMVVQSGSVVVDPEGQEKGTYIKLVLANVADPLYINVGTLVDLYIAKAGATQVQIAIDPKTREISATLVAGSVGTTELADDAVTTVKIADANVTKLKLSAEVQASLDKADAAATQADLDAERTRASEAEQTAVTTAQTYADNKVKTLADGQVAQNTQSITGLTGRVTELEANVMTPITEEEIKALFA